MPDRLSSASMKLKQLAASLHQALFRYILGLVEREVVPDVVARAGIRYLLSVRLQEAKVPMRTLQHRKQAFVDELKSMPIAIQTDKANEQHYELPTEYFTTVLGRWRKYSCCLYHTKHDSLDQAEANMLDEYCDKLALQSGDTVLDLGCGWGSFSLYAAQRYPSCSFTAVSNSRTQNVYISEQAKAMSLKNVKVITADMNDFKAPTQFDKVISIEMFEHMKNYQVLLKRVASWMKPGGLFFCHTFCHRTMPYHFEDNGDDDWMTRYFFSGGTMPSLDLFLYFQDDLRVSKLSYVNGMHYSRCLEAWLRLQDTNRAQLTPVFKETYGAEARKWFVYWRLFYMACSELFKYDHGEQWGLLHCTFEKPTQPNGS